MHYSWNHLVLSSLLLLYFTESSSVCQQPSQFSPFLPPTVTVGILVSNKAHVLPYFLTHFESLDYCKQRMSVIIKSDHNNDESNAVLKSWKASVQHLYYSVELDSPQEDLEGHDENVRKWRGWSDARYAHLIDLKEQLLSRAKRQWSHYLWFLDADVFITDNQTLNTLLEINASVVAPMLTSVGLYSNFWAGMSEDYYYIRTDQYLPILERKRLGCYVVPMVHSSVLIDLNREETWQLTFKKDKLNFFKSAPNDDIIVFALSANESSVPMHICNHQPFGYVMPSSADDIHEEGDRELKNVESLRLQVIADGRQLSVNSQLKRFLPPDQPKSLLGMDAVYMINLARRPERRSRMQLCFDILGIEHQLINAVDGHLINEAYLKNEGIEMLEVFSEPYHQRVMTMGEIGCFMSHYNVWLDVVEKKHEIAMVFEDDIRFEPYFRESLEQVLSELQDLEVPWDLIYLGRKIMHDANESWVPESNLLVYPDYTYWTLAYLISYKGATKLIEEEPKAKMVPVDEYFPIMYDRHPNVTWKAFFKNRDLKVLSVQPLLVHPTQYTGEEGYFSDTEDSFTIDRIKKKDEL